MKILLGPYLVFAVILPSILVSIDIARYCNSRINKYFKTIAKGLFYEYDQRIVIAAIISALVFAFLPSRGRSSTGRQRPEDDENFFNMERDDQDDKDGIRPGNG